MLKARSYEEGSVHSLRRSDVMDKSKNRQLKTGQTYKKREITGDKSPSREIDGVVPKVHGKADANMYGPPHRQGMDMEQHNK